MASFRRPTDPYSVLAPVATLDVQQDLAPPLVRRPEGLRTQPDRRRDVIPWHRNPLRSETSAGA